MFRYNLQWFVVSYLYCRAERGPTGLSVWTNDRHPEGFGNRRSLEAGCNEPYCKSLTLYHPCGVRNM